MPISSLDAILNPVSTESFFSDYFETGPLYIHRERPDFFGDLLSLDDIDNILTTQRLVHPHVRAVSAERTIEHGEYCRADHTIDPDRLLQLHADGATIILNHLHLQHIKLSELCAALENSFGAPLQTNIYLTPPHAKGFRAHFDTHDVFILQIEGRKNWVLYQQAIGLPLEGQSEDVEPGEQTARINLTPGESMYIPRGLVHDATSQDSRSLHVTLGILSYTWADVLAEAMAEGILGSARFRRALPRELVTGEKPTAEAEKEFRELIRALAETANLDSALSLFSRDFVEGRRPWLRGQLAVIGALGGVSLATEAILRPRLRASLYEDADSIHIRCYGKDIRIPRSAAEAVRFALSTSQFRVRDIPSDLDDQSKIVLIRRLAKEGLLTIC